MQEETTKSRKSIGLKTAAVLVALTAAVGVGNHINQISKITKLEDENGSHLQSIELAQGKVSRLEAQVRNQALHISEVEEKLNLSVDASAVEKLIERTNALSEDYRKLISSSRKTTNELQSTILDLKSETAKLNAEVEQIRDRLKQEMGLRSEVEQELQDYITQTEQALLEAAEQVEYYKQKATERANNLYDFELELEKQLEDELRFEDHSSLFLDHLAYQVADSGMILTDATPQGVEVPKREKVEFYRDRGTAETHPYALAVINKETDEIYKIFARPTLLNEDASTDGKGIWLSSHLHPFTYYFTAQEQKIFEYRKANDGEFRKWYDQQTAKVLRLCGFTCMIEWVDASLLREGILSIADKPVRTPTGQVSLINDQYTSSEGVLSFDNPDVTEVIVEDRSSRSSSDAEERVPGFLVTAFATGVTEGAVGAGREYDISKGVQLTFGVLAQWNEPSGTLWTSRGEKISPFPYALDTVYATIADGYLNITEAGTYEFLTQWGKLNPKDLAVFVNDKLVLGGLRSRDPIAVDLAIGEYPIKVIAYNPDPTYGLTEFQTVGVGDDYDSGEFFSQILGSDSFDDIRMRGFRFNIGYRKLGRDDWFKTIAPILSSLKAPKQPLQRLSGSNGVDYKIYTPTFATERNFNQFRNQKLFEVIANPKNDIRERLTLNPDAYATQFQSGTSDGRIDGISKNHLLEVSFDYDARVAGTYFIAPYIMTRLNVETDEDAWAFDRTLNEYDTLGVRLPNKCKIDLSAYDPDVSQTVPMTVGNGVNGIIYKAGIGSDFVGHLNITEPSMLTIKAKIACEEDFDLHFLVKDPKDAHFVPLGGVQ